MTEYNVAVVGATGAVGREMVSILEESSFPVGELKLLATERSAGKTLSFREEEITVEKTVPESFAGVDIALFSAGGTASKKLAPEAVNRGAVVIDNSSAFRMEEDVPLVVPEVNPEAIAEHNGIIANPNCSTIQMVVPLKTLEDNFGIERVVVSTYQAVSGTGWEAMVELEKQTGAILNGETWPPEVYPRQIAFNALPHIDIFQEEDYTKEEWKMVKETQKILNRSDLRVTATTVRIPVFIGHSESINVELKQSCELPEVRRLLSETKSVEVRDNPEKELYPCPLETEENDAILIGRLRRDLTVESGLNMWVVANNLRKGAALNAVQIAEEGARMEVF